MVEYVHRTAQLDGKMEDSLEDYEDVEVIHMEVKRED